MIKYLQLQQQFEAGKMQHEVARLEAEFWQPHYNKSHFEGEWTILPLRSINGSIENIISIHDSDTNNLNRYQDTVLLENCKYIKSVLDFFECEKTSVRLMKLAASAVIKEHRDHELSFEDGEVRFHIPVVTNTRVEFYLDDERVTMLEGECWYLNLSLMHMVKNSGTTARVHLVIDCVVNDWVKKLFSDHSLARKDISDEKVHDYSKEDKLKIIGELRRSNTPTALELAAKMESEF
jgi:Aspartyl/Asparaginyl beta-hydroxylase